MTLPVLGATVERMSLAVHGRLLALAILIVAGLVACGDDGAAQPDAAVHDARVDARSDPRDSGPCGAERFVTGELVDLDSTSSMFMGVANATFTVQGGTASDTTAPNGRFELCAPATDPVLLDLDAPMNRLDGTAYFDVDALTSFRPISFRSLTSTRAASFYVERGLVYDPARAHVLVFLAGDLSEVMLDRTHDTAQAGAVAMNGSLSWTAGTGRYTLFPNVDVTAATGTLTGDYEGPHTIPLVAGELTLVALAWVFL